jgi:hypothetical protein
MAEESRRHGAMTTNIDIVRDRYAASAPDGNVERLITLSFIMRSRRR